MSHALPATPCRAGRMKTGTGSSLYCHFTSHYHPL
jgi:hypothetical protein